MAKHGQHTHPDKDPSLLFQHKLTENDKKQLESIKSNLDADYQRRCKMLLDRLEVTVMSFFGSPRLEGKEEEIKNLYKKLKESIQCPEPATIDDVLTATTDLLVVHKTQGSSGGTIHKYLMTTAPPGRGGAELMGCAPSGSGPPTKNYRGNRRGKGGHGRGGHHGHEQHETPPVAHDLQTQIKQEIDRQLDGGPYFKQNKRGKDRGH